MAGSAWTNQVQFLVIVGGSPGAGVFVYDPTPGAGNLIFSATDALKDPFGNVTVKGAASYVTDLGVRYAVGLNAIQAGSLPGFSIQDTANPPVLPAGLFGAASATAGFAFASVFSGKQTAGDVQAVLAVHSQTDSGITRGQIIAQAGQIQLGQNSTLIVNDQTNQETANLSVALPAAPAAPGSGVSLYSDSSGHAAAVSSSGLGGSLSVTQTDISANSVGNTGTAGELTKLWSIPANDGITGTTYTIKALATMTTGPTTIETITIGADINNGVGGGGTLVPLATLGTAFNGGALSTTYAIPLELTLIVNAAGVSTPEIYLSGPLGDTSANRLATNSANMAGFSHAAAWNPTNLNTLSIYAQWGGAGGAGQTIGTIASRLYRDGP